MDESTPEPLTPQTQNPILLAEPVDINLPTLVMSPKELELERQAAQLEIVQRLVKAGLSAESTSTLTGVKLELIRRIVLKNKLTPEESMLSELARQVMAKSLTFLLYTLDMGDNNAKYNVAVKCVTAAMKLIGNQNDTGAEFEQALEAVFAMQRDIDAP